VATEKKIIAEDTTFEEALARLETLVRKLEDGRLPLGESLDLFTEGIELTRLCEKFLSEAEQCLFVLTGQEDGEIRLREIKQDTLTTGGGKIEL